MAKAMAVQTATAKVPSSGKAMAAAPAAKPDDGGVAIGGKKYYQIFTQARQN